MKGRFVSFEGGEGVGKSTQVRLLAQALGERGIEARVTREPGGSPGAETIRKLLMDGADDRWTARGEALLFAAARADHVARTIVPALDRGAWVLCDRFVDSSRAYQGGGGGLSDGDIMDLHRVGSSGLLPDRTILLTLDASVQSDRLAVRDGDAPDRMGRKPGDYQARLTARFAEMASAEPARWRVVDAGGAPEAVAARIFASLTDMLP